MARRIQVTLIDNDVYGRKQYKEELGREIQLDVFPSNNVESYDINNDSLVKNGLYFLVNNDTKEVYVGKTMNFKESRLTDHTMNKGVTCKFSPNNFS